MNTGGPQSTRSDEAELYTYTDIHVYIEIARLDYQLLSDSTD